MHSTTKFSSFTCQSASLQSAFVAHRYWIYYVNVDLHHQYGISVPGSQTFLRAKRPQRRRARRKGCFRRLPISHFLLGSRLTRHKFALCLDSNRNGCGISTVNWQIAYHYPFDTPTGFFCQMVSTPGPPFQNFRLSREFSSGTNPKKRLSFTSQPEFPGICGKW